MSDKIMVFMHEGTEKTLAPSWANRTVASVAVSFEAPAPYRAVRSMLRALADAGGRVEISYGESEEAFIQRVAAQDLPEGATLLRVAAREAYAAEQAAKAAAGKQQAKPA